MARMIDEDKCLTCTDGDRTIAALRLRCSDYNRERREKNARIAELEAIKDGGDVQAFVVLKKRIAELEAENAALRAQVLNVAKGLRRQWVKTRWGARLTWVEVAP